MRRYPATMLAVFSLTLFVSATLLFLVQPMIGKMITPLLGGTPAVWNTCMVFFQAVLLAGYAYAHASTTFLGVRRQALLHFGVLLLPFLFFPLAVDPDMIRGEENPVYALLLLLVTSVGVPFFVVSTSAPLLQKWFAGTPHPAARDPYFLYGSSNLGSMLALVGYPFVYEYFVTLPLQRTLWIVGYTLLVLLIGTCAIFLWLSTPAKPLIEASVVPAPDQAVEQERVHRQRGKGRKKVARNDAVPTSAAAFNVATPDITAARRCRWVLLAAVPSSLMLGVTTYLTTDIAAISWLWIPPLALYLLTFILVFSKLPPLLHRGMVLLLPLLILLLVFMILSEFKPAMQYNIALHLATLFVVAMVCHGELARDRPPPRALTEFFLWMSFGGVLGGLFNGLLAPLLFNSYVEYQLALVLACLLLPALGWERDVGKWNLYADAGLAALFLLFGGALCYCRLRDGNLSFKSLTPSALPWFGVALLLALSVVLFKLWRARERRLAFGFDLLLPAALLLFVLGLIWGLPSDALRPLVIRLSALLEITPFKVQQIITFGLPAILCYTFVERSTRFGLGIGAILLASAFSGLTDPDLLYQTRSFFGVLRVEWNGPYIRLIHGTTLHGKQYNSEYPDYDFWHDYPLTYYSRSGPVGHLFEAYNPNVRSLGLAAGPVATTLRQPGVRPNLGVIGLGTGTMACYGEPGQHLTFYEIDPAVRDISFNKDAYFSFVSDARERGVQIEDLVLGDARLTLQRQQLAEADKYGILVVDAFSSDAIPIHLINQNALRIFLEKMTKDGIIAFHISNRYLNLLPVLANLAQAENMAGLVMHDTDDESIGKAATTWVVLARKPEQLERLTLERVWQAQTGLKDWPKEQPQLRLAGCVAPALTPRWPGWTDLSKERDAKVGVWTDDYSNLLSVFRWK